MGGSTRRGRAPRLRPRITAQFLGFWQPWRSDGCGRPAQASHSGQTSAALRRLHTRRPHTADGRTIADDFGSMTALQAFTQLIQVLGFDLKVVKSERGAHLEPLG